MLEQPGPPLNQVASGAVVGLDRASKNQNHTNWVSHCLKGRAGDQCTIHIRPNGQIARVLIHTRGGLADSRVLDEFDFGSSGSMLEDSEVGAIALDKGALVMARNGSRSDQTPKGERQRDHRRRKMHGESE